MHLSDGEIRALLDRELDPGRTAQVQAHLSACPRCQARKQALFARSQRIDRHLATLQAPNQPHLSVGSARIRLSRRAEIELEEKETLPMLRKYFSRLSRPAWIGLAVVALLAISLAFAPVRAIAGSFLGLFRVQKIDVVQVDPNAISAGFNSSSFSTIMSESVKVTKGGSPQEVPDAQAASQLTGFTVRLPANMQPAYLTYQPGEKFDYKVNRQQLQALLAEIGHSDIQIPGALDGATVSVDIHDGAVAEYGDCPTMTKTASDPDIQQQQQAAASCTALVQMPSPTISAPPGLDMEAVGQAYLQVLGMSPADAANYAKNVDWSSTLVIPIPRSGTSTSSVSVDGVTGTLVTQYPGSPRGQYVLAWVKDGILYGLTGPGNGSSALDIANSLK
jgi:hypothetical protein